MSISNTMSLKRDGERAVHAKKKSPHGTNAASCDIDLSSRPVISVRGPKDFPSHESVNDGAALPSLTDTTTS